MKSLHIKLGLLLLLLTGCASSHYYSHRVTGAYDFNAFTSNLDDYLNQQGLIPYDMERAPKSKFDHAVYHNNPNEKLWRMELPGNDPEMPPCLFITLKGTAYPIELHVSGSKEILTKVDKLDRALKKWLTTNYPDAQTTQERIAIYDFK
jgi:hypothetical protein